MPKHSWSAPVRPDLNNTLRTCKRCGLVRVTRHEEENTPRHWTEFHYGEKRVEMRNQPSKTPPCGSYANILRSVHA